MSKILIAGESWTSHTIHIKGFDTFTTSVYEEGVKWLKEALEKDLELSKKFNSHINGKIVSLEDAILCDDGSIKVGSERVYSLR